jgi:hypothetical protein
MSKEEILIFHERAEYLFLVNIDGRISNIGKGPKELQNVYSLIWFKELESSCDNLENMFFLVLRNKGM